MAVRVAMLTDPLDARRNALWEALEEYAGSIELRVLWHGKSQADQASSMSDAAGSRMPASGGGVAGGQAHVFGGHASARQFSVSTLLGWLPFGSLLQLIAYRPHLVISEDFGALALHATVYRSIARRSRLLLCATDLPRQLGRRERVILGRADGILVDGEAVAHAIAQVPVPAARIFPLGMPYELDVFLRCVRTRTGAETHRVVYAGDLSPQSGAADLLISVASWAEQHPGQPIEIWWIGEGDLAGVLGAQPLPDNVTQQFLGCLDAPGMARAFGQCGLLVVPSLTDDRHAPVAEGLAAGLPVLGSRHNRRVRQLVRDDVNGWLFDPLQHADMFRALSRALDTPAEQLDRMRDQAQALVRPSAAPGFAQRMRGAVAAVMPELALEPASQQAQ